MQFACDFMLTPGLTEAPQMQCLFCGQALANGRMEAAAEGRIPVLVWSTFDCVGAFHDEKS